MKSPPINALVFFDIDGTLLRGSGPHHKNALIDAVAEVTGCNTTTDGIPLHGMLDHEIAGRMMAAAGLDERAVEEAMPGVMAAAQRLYIARGGPELSHAVCPGVIALLGQLEQLGIPLGIVSGNLEPIGWEKLRRAGLRRYFEFGAFADMGPTRTLLVSLALREARRRGYGLVGAVISLIGDSPNDVIAARNNGVRAVAVATGISSLDELRAEGPDLLLADLTSLRAAELSPLRTMPD